MSVATPAASRLLCRSLAANSAKTSSSSRAGASTSSSRPSIPPPPPPSASHAFHTSPRCLGRAGRRSPFRNVTARKMGLLDPERAPAALDKYKKLMSPDYDDTDVETLARKYTPEQLEALSLGERVVSAEDIVTQGRMRNDPYRPQYLDDFATTRPVLDRRPRTGTPVDTSARFMTPDEFEDDFLEWIREMNEKAGARQEVFNMEQALTMYEDMRSKLLKKEVGEGITLNEARATVDDVLGVDETAVEAADAEGSDSANPAEMMKKMKAKLAGDKDYAKTSTGEDEEAQMDDSMDVWKFLTKRNSMTGFDGGDTALAPELPRKVPGVAGLYTVEQDEEDAALDPEGTYQELRKQTGMTTQEIINMFQNQSKILVRRFVSNQTRLGKIRSAYVLAIAGNKNGRLGLGEAKSVDPETANAKAKLAAIKNMMPIRRYEQRTIYGNVEAKVGATIVQLYTRPPGFGLRVSHRFFEMARAAGISDLAAKMPRSRNPMNSVKACFQALTNQPDPEQIALGRGKKLVDARKVYYGGATI